MQHGRREYNNCPTEKDIKDFKHVLLTFVGVENQTAERLMQLLAGAENGLGQHIQSRLKSGLGRRSAGCNGATPEALEGARIRDKNQPGWQETCLR